MNTPLLFPPWFLQLSTLAVMICGLLVPVFLALCLIDQILLYIMRRRRFWRVASQFEKLAREVQEANRERDWRERMK